MFKSNEEYEKFLSENVLTTQEAMRLLGINHRQQLYRWVKNGKLKPLKVEGNTSLFSLQEIERFKSQLNR